MHILRANVALLALLLCGFDVAKGVLDDPDPPDYEWNVGASTWKPGTGKPGTSAGGGSGDGSEGSACQSKQCSLYNGTTKYVSTRGKQTGLWIINDKNQLLQLDTIRNTWMKELDNVAMVSVAHKGLVWAVCKQGNGAQFLTLKRPPGMAVSRWQNIGTKPFHVTQISASSTSDQDLLVGLDSQGRLVLFKDDDREWMVMSDPGSSKWISMTDDFTTYSVGKGDHAVYYMYSDWVKLKNTYAETVDAYSNELRLYTDYESRVFVWIKGAWKQQPFRADQAVITKEGGVYFVYRGILGYTMPK